jgi:UDP-N-acetylglucosamine diphosphorylase / glucose-1-phosphate thymidylyltransferase / UDP-N-acetylgalactosamine diphosphorylase / glucosamine-1-phosphate N-acetyltransferase / galactosamine-1-phosphate N-acetyltransferase
MKIILFEDEKVLNLEPLTINRPVFDLRYGSNSLLGRMHQFFPKNSISLWVRKSIKNLVSELYPSNNVNQINDDNLIWLNARVLWNSKLIEKVLYKASRKYKSGDDLIAANLNLDQSITWIKSKKENIKNHPNVKSGGRIDCVIIDHLWDLIELIPEAVKEVQSAIKNKKKYENVYFNENLGPVVLGENVQIEPFCYLEGPIFIGENTIIKSNSRISNSIIGPHCKIGGEVSGTIIQGYTNKSHYGYIGDSFIGEWVNLGAGTTNSNLKNNYKSVSMVVNDQLINSNKLFLGSFIGDHTKTSIGTMLNTGTKIGIGCNVLSHSFPSRNISSFSFINNNQIKKITLKEFIEVAEKVKSRRNKVLLDQERKYFNYIYNSM